MKYVLFLMVVFLSHSFNLSALAAPVPLVNRGDTWLYHKGTNAAQVDWKDAQDADRKSVV